MKSVVFLLSPASCRGRRAQIIMSERASFELAERLRSSAGAPLGDVFSFLSGLYFRGKLAYARAFAAPSHPAGSTVGGGVFVITPDGGMPYRYTSRYAGDHPDPAAPVIVAERLARPR